MAFDVGDLVSCKLLTSARLSNGIVLKGRAQITAGIYVGATFNVDIWHLVLLADGEKCIFTGHELAILSRFNDAV
jgi:hypothetical protein